MKRVKRRSFLAWLLIFAMMMSQISYAGSWIQMDDIWYYQEAGKNQTGWIEEKDQWYYMDAAGVMQTGWHLENANDWYYLNTASDEGIEGAMKTGWFLQDDTWFFLNTIHDGFCGRAMTDGWYWIDGYCYLFDANGKMYADCTTPDGYEVNADGQWIVDGVVQYIEGKGIITKAETKSFWDWLTDDDDDDDDDYGSGGSGGSGAEDEEPTIEEPSTEEPTTEEPTTEEPTTEEPTTEEPTTEEPTTEEPTTEEPTTEEPTTEEPTTEEPTTEEPTTEEPTTEEPTTEEPTTEEPTTEEPTTEEPTTEEPTTEEPTTEEPTTEEPTTEEPTTEEPTTEEPTTEEPTTEEPTTEEPTTEEPTTEEPTTEEPTTEEPTTEEPTTEAPGQDPTDPENPGGDPTDPEDPDETGEIEFDEESIELEIGMNYKLDPGISPEGIIWKTSDPTVAKVSALGTVLALSAGTVTITAELETDEGTVSDTCVVTVIDDDLILSESELTLKKGEFETLTLSNTDQIPNWLSSNTDIVSVVSVDENGKNVTIEAVGGGTATISADVENRNVSCLVKVLAVDLEEGTETTVTRGEWIAELLEAAGYNWYVLDEEELEWHYSDTEASEDYGMAVEFAYISGFLPEDEEGAPIVEDTGVSEGTGQWTKPAFSLNEPVTREFAAVTGVRALQYDLSGNAPDCSDRGSLNYKAEAGVAVRQSMLFLNDEKEFRPEDLLTEPEKEQFITTVENIKLSEKRLTSLKPGDVEYEEVVYTPDTIGSDQLTEISYEVLKNEDDGSHLEVVLHDCTEVEIRAGNNLILPASDDYPRGLSIYVETLENQEDDILITGYMQTDIYELVQELKFEGAATPIFDQAYILDSSLPQGVTVEYDPEGYIDVPSSSTYGIDYGDMILDGTIRYKFEDFEITDHLKLNGSVSFEIPNITLRTDADFSILSGVEMSQFIFSITEKMNVDAGFTVEGSSERYPGVPGSIELKRFPFALGTTGFFVDFVISFYYSAEGEVKFIYTIQATEGLAYENNDFRYIGEFWQDLQPIALNAKAEAGLKPAANLSFIIIPDIVGVANEIGAAAEGTVTTHELQGVSCLDGNIYLSSKIMLNDETIVGMLLKELLDLELEYQYWNEVTSPLRFNTHYENGSKVEECTVYSGEGDLYIWVSHGTTYGPLEGAMVTLLSGNRIAAAAFTDADGYFKFKNIRAGIYNVVISAKGYESCKYRYRINSGENYFYPVYLEERQAGAPEYGYNITLDGWIVDDETTLNVDNVSYKVYMEDYQSSGYLPLYEGKCNSKYTISLPDNHFYCIVFEAKGYETKTLYMINSSMHNSTIWMTAE